MRIEAELRTFKVLTRDREYIAAASRAWFATSRRRERALDACALQLPRRFFDRVEATLKHVHIL